MFTPAMLNMLKLIGTKEVSKGLAEAGTGFAEATKNGLADAAKSLDSMVTKIAEPAISTLQAQFTSQTMTDQVNLTKAFLELAQTQGVKDFIHGFSTIVSIILQGGTGTVNALTAFSKAFDAAQSDREPVLLQLQKTMTSSTDTAGNNLDKLQQVLDKASSTTFQDSATLMGTLLGKLIDTTGLVDGLFNQINMKMTSLILIWEKINEVIDGFIDRMESMKNVFDKISGIKFEDPGWF